MRLTNKRYEQIKEIINCFYDDYNVDIIPIDIFELAQKMKIKIVKLSEIKNNEISNTDLPNSFFIYDDEMKQIIIYLDDINTKYTRQRFSLAHEIAHIILNHNEQNYINETEANFAATYLLAPTCLALIRGTRKYFKDVYKIMNIFNISYKEAQIVINYFEKRYQLDCKIKPYEKEINARFKDSLFNLLNKYK